jgi:hypothetical protein
MWQVNRYCAGAFYVLQGAAKTLVTMPSDISTVEVVGLLSSYYVYVRDPLYFGGLFLPLVNRQMFARSCGA